MIEVGRLPDFVGVLCCFFWEAGICAEVRYKTLGCNFVCVVMSLRQWVLMLEAFRGFFGGVMDICGEVCIGLPYKVWLVLGLRFRACFGW